VEQRVNIAVACHMTSRD